MLTANALDFVVRVEGMVTLNGTMILELNPFER